MRYSRTALTALTCALVLAPVGAAHAASGPATPAPRSTERSTAPSPEGNPLSDRARAAEVCPDARQIGATAYVDRNGAHIASVKQFYSAECQENYAYLWVWQSYRDANPEYDVELAVYDHDNDTVLGQVGAKRTDQQEFWSEGTDTVQQCTSALGTVRTLGDPLPDQARTAKRC